MNHETPQILNTLNLRIKLNRSLDDHKGLNGKVLLIGGSSSMVGAIILAGQASLYSGAGWTIIGIGDEHAIPLIVDQPELMVCQSSLEIIEKYNPDVIGIGPGFGQDTKSEAILMEVLKSSKLIVVDADALNLIAKNNLLLNILKKRLSEQTIITPHPGEAARLLRTNSEQIQKDRFLSIQQLIKHTNAITILKGHDTLIGSPQHDIVICKKGNPGMATGGMGDVLTGLLASLLAQGIRHGLNSWESACLAVELHAQAADNLVAREIGPVGLTPMEVIKEIRALINLKT